MTIAVARIAPQTAGAQSFLARQHCKMLIGEQWVNAASGKTIDSVNPATGEVLATIPAGERADVERAVQAARASFESGVWRDMPGALKARVLWKMADLMEANLDELAELETLDQGKPIWVGKYAEIPGGIEQFRYFAGQATKIEGTTIPTSISYQPPGKKIFAYTLKQPIGVVAAIVPWNSPIVLTAMKLAPALAAGCSIVLKPAEDTSLTALRLGELLLEAGLPPGVLNIVTGLGKQAGAALAEHTDVDKVAFTGSTEVGKLIVNAARSNLKKVTIELGGKSPAIILDDADLELAIPGAANAIFFNSGQVCVAGSRLYVHHKLYDKVLAGVVDYARKLKLGNGLDPSVQLGPVVSAKHADRVMSYIDAGVQQGAEAIVGGKRAAGTTTFIEPTVLARVNAKMSVVREEIFGPVVVAAPFKDVSEIPAIANDSVYGLGASVWTNNLSAAHRLAADIRAGSVWINCHPMYDASLPIGGVKQSGWGRDSGHQAVENYLETKTVCAVI
ncbi:MAG TPA: aldehyde dehydrogenase family protein [Steroidobacteraceae bacterium]|nr:aldehyde dehydrogenase family protein [Steroidobacteraceae bacterium]